MGNSPNARAMVSTTRMSPGRRMDRCRRERKASHVAGDDGAAAAADSTASIGSMPQAAGRSVQ